MRVAVVGAGVMGLAAAAELALRDVRVTVYERDTVGNELASSTDRSKVFRFAYPDPFYADLGRRALPLWRELEARSGDELLEQCGVVYLDTQGSAARETYDALRSIGAPGALLDAPALSRRFPQFTPPPGTLAAWDPSGGFVRADRAVATFARLARERGVEIRERAAVGSLDELEADAVIIAAGPWSRGLLPDLPLRTSRQLTVYARPTAAARYEPGTMPVFIEEQTGFYGVPIHADGALKIARHKRGAEHPPLTQQAPASDEFIAQCREFWSEFLPGLAGATIVRSRSCIYNDTPDEDFLIGKHTSGAMLCTGFSGHGFKFAPLIGRLVAQLVCGEPTDVDLGRFAPRRAVRTA